MRGTREESEQVGWVEAGRTPEAKPNDSLAGPEYSAVNAIALSKDMVGRALYRKEESASLGRPAQSNSVEARTL